MTFPRGLYDLVLTEAVARSLDGVALRTGQRRRARTRADARVSDRQWPAAAPVPVQVSVAAIRNLPRVRGGAFHWQTQNSAGPHTDAGRRYIESATNGWRFQLFVRVRKSDPYRACGPVRIASADDVTGDRPMNITWTLGVPLPPKLFAELSVLRGQG